MGASRSRGPKLLNPVTGTMEGREAYPTDFQFIVHLLGAWLDFENAKEADLWDGIKP
jgi:hypothetical protein